LAESGEKDLVEDALKWPRILAKGDMAMYRLEDARRLIIRDKEAMMMAFSATELDDPFG
jgi:hypothetical protein